MGIPDRYCHWLRSKPDERSCHGNPAWRIDNLRLYDYIRIYILDKSGYIPMNRSGQAGASYDFLRSRVEVLFSDGDFAVSDRGLGGRILFSPSCELSPSPASTQELPGLKFLVGR